MRTDINNFIKCILHFSFICKTISLPDHNGKGDKAFAIAGFNDTDASPGTTTLTSPGFNGKEHPRECLNFWFDVKVSSVERFSA